MPTTLRKPEAGEDVRLLHRDVSKLVSGINALTNMTAVWNGRVKGVGRLAIRGGESEIYIKIEDFRKGGGGGLVLPSMSITASKNPIKETNSAVFTCNILGARDGSTVLFSSNGVGIGVFTVANQIARTNPVVFDVAGNYNIRADFSGDAAHLPGFVSMVEHVTARPTPNMNFVSSKNPSDHGDDIYFAVDMSDNLPDPPPAPQTPLPTGTVSFYHNDAGYDTKTLDGNHQAFSVHNTNFSPGHHHMEAHYNGNSEWDEVSKTLDQVVKASAELVMNIVPGPTTPTGVRFVIYIEVHATHGLPTPTGQVAIHNNGNTSGWYNLDGQGHAAFSVEAGLPIGNYTWFFDYSGDSHYSQDYSPTYIQYVVPRAPRSLDISLAGNTLYFGFRLYINWPPGLPGIFQVQLHDPTGGNFNGTIGIQFVSMGGHGYMVLKEGGVEIFRGTPNLYFNGVAMIGNAIYFNMTNGYATLWISWNTQNHAAWDYNGPILESSDGYGNPAFVFLRLFDPYDGSTIGGELSNFLDP